MSPNPQFLTDLVTFTGENGKLHFMCSGFDEGFLCDKPGLASLSDVNMCQGNGTPWLTLRYVD